MWPADCWLLVCLLVCFVCLMWGHFCSLNLTFSCMWNVISKKKKHEENVCYWNWAQFSDYLHHFYILCMMSGLPALWISQNWNLTQGRMLTWQRQTWSCYRSCVIVGVLNCALERKVTVFWMITHACHGLQACFFDWKRRGSNLISSPSSIEDSLLKSTVSYL